MPPAAGVAGFESEAFSGLDVEAAGRVAEVAGESFASFDGVSSLTTGDDGWRMACSFSGVTMSLMTNVGLLPVDDDLRRSLAGVAAALVEGAMMSVVVGLSRRWNEGQIEGRRVKKSGDGLWKRIYQRGCRVVDEAGWFGMVVNEEV